MNAIRSIGIIGAGDMGGALATALSEAYDVRVAGARASSPNVATLLETTNGRVKAGDLAGCAGADITFVVVPWEALRDVAARLAPLRPKRVVSVVVPWNGDNALPAVARDESAAEILAKALDSRAVVNAFTSIGASTIREIERYEERPTVFLASDDQDLKRILKDVASSIGFDSIDAGPLYAARFTESLGFLWIALAFDGGNGEMIGFRAVRPHG